MNILFFLSPKQDLMYVYDDFTLRQTLEKWENNRYASIPVLNRRGEYVGTLTEGDILWGLKKFHGLDLEAAEDVPISAFPHKRDYKAVTVTTSMDQLIEAAMNQNFVPVVDDRGIFIGIVRRQAIIRYCYEKSREEKAPILEVSARTGRGLDELAAATRTLCGAQEPAPEEIAPNLRQARALENALAELRDLERDIAAAVHAAEASCRNQPPPEKLLPAQPRAACKKPRINRRVERKKRFCTKPHAPLPFPLVLDKV